MNKHEHPRSRRPALSVYLLAVLTMMVLLGISESTMAQSQWTTNGNDINNANTGNVGIGTASPKAKLDVKQSADSFMGGLHLRRSTTNDTWALVTGNDNSLWMGYANNASLADSMTDFTVYPLVLTANNRVGIGTHVPASKLDVSGTVNATAFTVNGSPFIGSQWTTSGTSINYAAGNVGIGTTTPGYKLDVAGEIRSSTGGFRFPDGSLQTTAASGSGGVPSVFGRTGVVVAAANDYTWAQINKTTSSLADLTTRSASDLSSGTVPDARFPATLPAISGANLTSLNASSLATGTVTPARLGSGTANSTTFLRGDNTWTTIPSSQWANGTGNINYTGGNVGIGISSPTEKLHVTGNIAVTGTGNITASGTIEGGNIKAKYQDVAEWVPSSEQLSAATVVILDPSKSNQVIASAQAYDTRVAGVISAQPGITLGEGGEGKVLVAITGRVRVKVDASRGAVQIGDLLVTSDVPGVAMKSEAVEFAGRKMHMPGTIIGKALEPFAKGSGEILVLLSLQ